MKLYKYGMKKNQQVSFKVKATYQNNFTLKLRKLNTEGTVPSQVAWRGCGVSMHRDINQSFGRGPEQLALGVAA